MAEKAAAPGRQARSSPWLFRWWGIILIFFFLILGIVALAWLGRLILPRPSILPSELTDQYASLLSPDRYEGVATEDDPVIGGLDALVTLVEFGDFTSETSRQVAETVRQIVSEYGSAVRFIYRDFPDQKNSWSERLAKAGVCAHAQGKFWIFHDRLFLRTDIESDVAIKQLASEVSLDRTAFDSCYDERRFQDEVAGDFQDGLAADVKGTPTFFFNGYRVEGVLSRDDFYGILDLFVPSHNPNKLEIPAE